MKLVKIGLAVAAIASLMLAVGCAEKKPPPPTQPAAQVQPPVYHGKLGTMPATYDQSK